MNKRNNILIGITGGIGSGKTIVSDYLSGLGEHVIYADETAREVVLPGQPGNEEVKRAFGEVFFLNDGSLNRKKLAGYVFSSKEKLEKLNGILHPIILDRIYSQADALSGRVFIEVPLLIQSGMHKNMDFVWLVVADRETRIKRVMERDGLEEELIVQRLEHQMSDEEMAAYADEIIENNGSAEDVYKSIDTLLNKPEYVVPSSLVMDEKSEDFREQ